MQMLATNRSRSGKLKLVLLAGLAAWLVMSTLAVLPAHAATGTLTADPASYRPGQQPLVSGTGYQANERIDLWLTAPTGKVIEFGYTIADYAGSFTDHTRESKLSDDDSREQRNLKTLNIPGQWYVTARGVESNTQSIASFTVVNALMEASVYNVYGGQVTVTYTGKQFYPGERITLWITAQDGKVIPVGYTWATAEGLMPAIASDDDDDDGWPNNSFKFTGGTGPYMLTAYGHTSQQTVVAQVKNS